MQLQIIRKIKNSQNKLVAVRRVFPYNTPRVREACGPHCHTNRRSVQDEQR